MDSFRLHPELAPPRHPVLDGRALASELSGFLNAGVPLSPRRRFLAVHLNQASPDPSLWVSRPTLTKAGLHLLSTPVDSSGYRSPRPANMSPKPSVSVSFTPIRPIPCHGRSTKIACWLQEC